MLTGATFQRKCKQKSASLEFLINIFIALFNFRDSSEDENGMTDDYHPLRASNYNAINAHEFVR